MTTLIVRVSLGIWPSFPYLSIFFFSLSIYFPPPSTLSNLSLNHTMVLQTTAMDGHLKNGTKTRGPEEALMPLPVAEKANAVQRKALKESVLNCFLGTTIITHIITIMLVDISKLIYLPFFFREKKKKQKSRGLDNQTSNNLENIFKDYYIMIKPLFIVAKDLSQ